MSLEIWIVSLFEPTPADNTRPMRYMGIANAAIDQGHHVSHISCSFRHSTKIQRFNKNHIQKVSELYELIFVYAKPYKKNISIERLSSHRMFTRNLMNLVGSLKKPDVILVALPPITPALALTKWGKQHGIPVYIDIIDPWPDVFLRLAPEKIRGILKLGLRPMYNQLRQILVNCSGVTAISEEYIRWAKSFDIPIKKAEAFLPAVPFTEVQSKIINLKRTNQRTDDGLLTIIYAGNLGIAYDIPTILKAAEILEKWYPQKTRFIIAGLGHYVPMIKDYVNQIKNVVFLGRIDYDELMLQYANADLGLAQYSKGATQSVTYKFFDYLSAGLPILNSLISEMADLVDHHMLGINNVPGDHEQLAKNIKSFIENPDLLAEYKKNAVSYTAINGDSEVVYSKLIKFISQ